MRMDSTFVSIDKFFLLILKRNETLQQLEKARIDVQQGGVFFQYKTDKKLKVID